MWGGGAGQLLQPRLAPFAAKARAHKCTYCGTCQRCCPVDIESVYKERSKLTVTDPKCLLCLRCVQECPEEGCLEANFGGKTIVRS